MRGGQKSARRDLEALYERRFADFVLVARVIVDREQQAIDVVQETFARALAAVDSYRAEGPLEAWVWRILVNTARSQLSRAEPGSVQLADVLESANGHVVDESPVRKWVAALPERQRLVVFLRYYADLDYRSIAAVLGIEVGTVSATLSAAHTSLRKLIKEVPR